MSRVKTKRMLSSFVVVVTFFILLLALNCSDAWAVDVAYVKGGSVTPPYNTKDSTVLDWLRNDLGYNVTTKAYADSLRGIGTNWDGVYELVIISLNRLSGGAYTDTIFAKPIPVLTMHHNNYDEGHFGVSASWISYVTPKYVIENTAGSNQFITRTENDTTFGWNTNMYLGRMDNCDSGDIKSVIGFNYSNNDTSIYLFCDSGGTMLGATTAPHRRTYFGLLADSSAVPTNWNWCSMKRIFLREVARMTVDTLNDYFSEYVCFSDNDLDDIYFDGCAPRGKINHGKYGGIYIGEDWAWVFPTLIRPDTSVVNQRIPNLSNWQLDSANIQRYGTSAGATGNWRCSVGVARIIVDTQWVEGGTTNASPCVSQDSATEDNNWACGAHAKYTEQAWAETCLGEADYDYAWMDTIYYAYDTWSSNFWDTLQLNTTAVTEQLNLTSPPNGFVIKPFWTNAAGNDTNMELVFRSSQTGISPNLNYRPRMEYCFSEKPTGVDTLYPIVDKWTEHKVTGCTDHYDCLDDGSDDSYIFRGDTLVYLEDIFWFKPFTSYYTSIDSVEFVMRAKKTGILTVKTVFGRAGKDAEFSNWRVCPSADPAYCLCDDCPDEDTVTLTTSWADYNMVMDCDPCDNGAWTAAKLDTLNGGINNHKKGWGIRSISQNVYCSELYLIVYYQIEETLSGKMRLGSIIKEENLGIIEGGICR